MGRVRFPIRFTGANHAMRILDVHGWRGKWLVNGSSSGLVRIDLEPPAHARTGPVPITVRELTVSVDDREELVAALALPQ